jgi:hypothetical protein
MKWTRRRTNWGAAASIRVANGPMVTPTVTFSLAPVRRPIRRPSRNFQPFPDQSPRDGDDELCDDDFDDFIRSEKYGFRG